jgi:hypothetical protein
MFLLHRTDLGILALEIKRLYLMVEMFQTYVFSLISC